MTTQPPSTSDQPELTVHLPADALPFNQHSMDSYTPECRQSLATFAATIASAHSICLTPLIIGKGTDDEEQVVGIVAVTGAGLTVLQLLDPEDGTPILPPANPVPSVNDSRESFAESSYTIPLTARTWAPFYTQAPTPSSESPSTPPPLKLIVPPDYEHDDPTPTPSSPEPVSA